MSDSRLSDEFSAWYESEDVIAPGTKTVIVHDVYTILEINDIFMAGRRSVAAGTEGDDRLEESRAFADRCSERFNKVAAIAFKAQQHVGQLKQDLDNLAGAMNDIEENGTSECREERLEACLEAATKAAEVQAMAERRILLVGGYLDGQESVLNEAFKFHVVRLPDTSLLNRVHAYGPMTIEGVDHELFDSQGRELWEYMHSEAGP